MADCGIVELQGVRLEADRGVTREFTRPPERRDADYLARYDATTLIYDGFWRPESGIYVMTAPLFFNLWAPFAATLRCDGQTPKKLRRWEQKRSENVFLHAPRGTLTAQIGGQAYTLPGRVSEAPRFRGLNTVIAVSKNNRLDWIADWARYNVERHGAEGVALVDNGSTDYALEDLAGTLGAVPGLKAALVYSAPFPYGPRSSKSHKSERGAKFFQSAMLNLLRVDATAQAAAVLNVDIDELVDGPEGETIFEAARRHPLGMVTTKGFWAYPAADMPVPVGHAAHRFRSRDNKQNNRKWCIVPDGVIGRRFYWDPHQVGGLLQNLFTEQKRFTHIHCKGCSTGWKPNRWHYEVELVPDPRLDAVLDRYFAAPRQAGVG